MLGNSVIALSVLSFFSHAYGLEARSTAMSICEVNGTFAVGSACPENANSVQISNGAIIEHPSASSPAPSSTTSRVESSSPVSSSSPSPSPTSSSTPPSSPSASSPSASSPSAPSPSASSSPSPPSSSSISSTGSSSILPVSTSSSSVSSSGTTSSTDEKSFVTTPSSSAAKSSSTPNRVSTSNAPGSTLPVIGNAPAPKGSGFVLDTLYQGEDFINAWDFFDNSDPTHGNVQYLNQQAAVSAGLIQVQGNTTIISVDDTTVLPVGKPRNSVRISSQKRVTGGLIIADIEAMPTGCATWPAFWAVGDSWPSHGEVDIIEGVNRQSMNQMTLHTLPGCTRDDNAKPAPGQSKAFTGTPLQVTCDVTVNSNSGCGIMSTQANSFGSGFNNNGGGVYATIWDTMGFRIYYFPRNSIPKDILNMDPTPGTWPTPDAFWDSTTCPVDHYFGNLALVFDTTLCGDFAGSLFGSSGCPGTCAGTVADPDNFKNAKWKINYVAVYT